MYLRSMALLLIGLAAISIALLTGAVLSQADEFNPAAVRQEVVKLIADLDSERFDVRRAAAGRLELLSSQRELTSLLTTEFQKAAKAPNASLEMRFVLEPLLANLAESTQKPDESPARPEVPSEANFDVSPGELRRLIDALEADSFQARSMARDRLQSLLAEKEIAIQAFLSMKRRLADPNTSAESRQVMQRLCEEVRAAWLLSEPSAWEMPEPTPAQVAGWLDDLVRPIPNEWKARAWPVHESAAQELLDLLVRDAWLPKVKAELEARLAIEVEKGSINEPTDAAKRIKRVLDWTRPAMVAEFWQGAQHRGIQHLLIGVPNHAEHAERASHFDRCDDESAHCVSGNALTAGNDYPVGIFFIHPKKEDAQFHLVNLSTPRRRLAYEHQVKIDEAKRFAAISERTVAWLLKQKRPLSEDEVKMLRQIDPGAVSRFAGRYFSAIDDEPYNAESELNLAGRTSRHGMLCAVLAENGTKDAIPGLMAAIQAKRFLPPATSRTFGDSPYNLPWIAALAIAGRDPWPEVDDWLAGLVARTSPLKVGQPNPPELGATAAALLLRRHSVPTAIFSLEQVEDNQFSTYGCAGFRFAIPEKRAEVSQWWVERKNRVAAAGGS